MVGINDGPRDGPTLGTSDGPTDGPRLGSDDSVVDGVTDGPAVGENVGNEVVGLGLLVGARVVVGDGVTVG